MGRPQCRPDWQHAMFPHQHYDLGHVIKGSTVVVSLGSQANVRLMSASDYRSFKSGGRYRMYGGSYRQTPVRLTVPSSGRWMVVVDLGGLAGKVRSGVNVVPPAPGLLAAGRQQSTAQQTDLSNITTREPVEPPSSEVLAGQTWDVFMSHASEDKNEVAIPLRDALAARGVRVWLDVAELKIGSSLRRRIDQGILSSRFGIVVLSHSFFAKGWPNHELDGLVTRTNAGEQSILPIWHNVDADDVRGYSPSLADKVALSSSTTTIEEMADQIAEVVLPNANAA